MAQNVVEGWRYAMRSAIEAAQRDWDEMPADEKAKLAAECAAIFNGERFEHGAGI